MNIVQPPPLLPTASSVAASNAAPTASAPIAAVSGTLLAGGMAIAQLAPGSMLRALVMGRNEGGQLVLDMGKVKVALATQANLPAGTEVMVQVRSGGARMQVTVQPVPAEGHPSGRQGAAAPQAGATASPGAQTPQAAPPPAPQAPHVAGLTTTAVVVAGPPAEAPADGAAASPTPRPSAPAPGPSGPAVSGLSAGTSLALRINAVLPPGEPVPPQLLQSQTAQPGAAGAVRIGVVSALTASGHPLVQTQAGLLLISSRLSAPVGATIVLELDPAASAADPDSQVAGAERMPGRSPSGTAQPFGRLAQALDTLREAGAPPPDLARQLPHTGRRLAEGLISAFATMREGDGLQSLEQMLRPALERLGHRDMADALRQELARPPAGPATQSDWRAYVLPLLDDGQLHQLRIYERQQRDGGQAGAGGNPHGSRFVVEVEMSRLGAMQLDGLVQPKRFDLMLRTRQMLPEEMRREIAAIFAEARSAAGFAGEIGFQQTPVFPVNPKAAEVHGPGVVV